MPRRKMRYSGKDAPFTNTEGVGKSERQMPAQLYKMHQPASGKSQASNKAANEAQATGLGKDVGMVPRRYLFAKVPDC